MSTPLTDIMERASQALALMNYAACEALCLEALRAARDQRDWSYYARILLPLQEARRQRRIIAAEGVLRLGTTRLIRPAVAWLAEFEAGCIVVTHPFTAEEARQLDAKARRLRQHVEVLFADNAADADTWTLRAFAGPAVSCAVPAPPAAWRDRWLAAGEHPGSAGVSSATPADWFINATEALGDAAIEQADADLGTLERIEQLEQMLQVVTDHELLHQRLGDAARAVRHGADQASI